VPWCAGPFVRTKQVGIGCETMWLGAVDEMSEKGGGARMGLHS